MIHENSTTWITIRAYLEEQLVTLRGRNDLPLSPNETDQLRGEIRAVKDLLALPKTLAARDTSGSLGFEVGSTDDYED